MEAIISQEPILLFRDWYNPILSDVSIKEPNAVALATADKSGYPSLRIVLLKSFDDNGFCFYTNLTSRKGSELNENPNAAMCFFWPNFKRQVRIEGKVNRVSEKEAENYFASRQRGSQIGAWASRQSSIMQNNEDLQKRVKNITEQFIGQNIPKPPFWSGFRLIPAKIEFWQEGEFRLHSRILYSKIGGLWQSDRLYP